MKGGEETVKGGLGGRWRGEEDDHAGGRADVSGVESEEEKETAVGGEGASATGG